MEYDKPARTFDEQVQLLVDRGMHVPDRARARACLAHTNYYRLVGYWLVFEQEHDNHVFLDGTTFDDVLNLYAFDRELRLLLLGAIERVEVSMRTNWAYHLALRHGPHAHLDARLFDPKYWGQNVDRLKSEVAESREKFIRHYMDKYDVPPLPPTWAVCEIMTLGTLSRWYQSLIPLATRSSISGCYDLDDTVLASFLQHLAYLRNLCAHHSRVWNRMMTKTMSLPKTKPKGLIDSFNPEEPRKLYNSLVMLAWILDLANPGHSWKTRLLNLIREHRIDPDAMGFPDDFPKRGIWRSVASRS